MGEQRLFISHASEDEAVVNRIVAYLEGHGVACWIASRDIPPRSIYAEEITKGIQVCSACAVIVSAAANASKAVKRELELASHYDKPFIPIRIDATEPGPGLDYYLRNAQWIDYAKSGQSGLDRIASIVGDSPPPTPSAPARSPVSAPPLPNSAAAEVAVRVRPRKIVGPLVAATILLAGLGLGAVYFSGLFSTANPQPTIAIVTSAVWNNPDIPPADVEADDATTRCTQRANLESCLSEHPLTVRRIAEVYLLSEFGERAPEAALIDPLLVRGAIQRMPRASPLDSIVAVLEQTLEQGGASVPDRKISNLDAIALGEELDADFVLAVETEGSACAARIEASAPNLQCQQNLAYRLINLRSNKAVIERQRQFPSTTQPFTSEEVDRPALVEHDLVEANKSVAATIAEHIVSDVSAAVGLQSDR